MMRFKHEARGGNFDSVQNRLVDDFDDWCSNSFTTAYMSALQGLIDYSREIQSHIQSSEGMQRNAGRIGAFEEMQRLHYEVYSKLLAQIQEKREEHEQEREAAISDSAEGTEGLGAHVGSGAKQRWDGNRKHRVNTSYKDDFDET